MSENTEQRTEQAQPSEQEEIFVAPAAFKPADKSATLKKAWIKPASLAVLIVFLLLLAVVSYVFTAKSVLIKLTPQADSIELNGGLAFKIGDRYLLRQGEYRLIAESEGFYPLDEKLQIGEQQEQEVTLDFRMLPGLVSFSSEPPGAQVLLDDELIGVTPLQNAEVEPGSHSVSFNLERYLPVSQALDVEGRAVEQSMEQRLTPAWSEISVSSVPEAADIFVDGEARGQTPARLEILQGTHSLVLIRQGYKSWDTELRVAPNEPQVLDPVVLKPVDGAIIIHSSPNGANVTVNETFRGKTPLTLELAPGKEYRIDLFKSGFQAAQTKVTPRSGSEQQVNINLQPILASILVQSDPADAEVYVNGQLQGRTNNSFDLPAEKQRLEIRKPGYATYTMEVTPRVGLEQRVAARLKTLEQAKWEEIKPTITTKAGQNLKLFRPGSFTMGASRREAGRRANEALRDIKLTKPFYLATHEVTNRQYRLFKSGHSSGNVKGNSLDGEDQPAVNLAWIDAAGYCNWLSKEEGLEQVYQINDGKLGAVNLNANGYRLPTEAEWAWAARTQDGQVLKYPWGESLPPSEKSGNYADISAANIVGRVISNYQDSFAVSAPVGSFAANQHGLFDMGGNVSEWVNDYYGTYISLSQQVEVDPSGPESGEYYVIRGSSWAHGAITELRLSYRDYGTDARNDLGFRIARLVER